MIKTLTRRYIGRGVSVANQLDCDFVVSKLGLKSLYYAHFKSNTQEKKRMNLLIFLGYGLNSTTTFLQYGWL